MKTLKRWSAPEDTLIEKFNPTWRDLAEDWFKPETQGSSTSIRAIPTAGIANPDGAVKETALAAAPERQAETAGVVGD